MAFWIVSGCLLFPFLFFLLLGYVSFRLTIQRRSSYPADRREFGGRSPLTAEGYRILRESRDWFDTQALEETSIRSHDGLTLRGSFLPAKGEKKGIVLLFHGYHSSCRRDLSAQSMILHRAGYHLLLVTQRSHKESEGKYICFGIKERLDVAPWCKAAIERFGGDLPVYLFGLSMGGATVLMSAGTPLPPQVRGIVGDCGFSSPFDIIRYNLWRKYRLPPIPTIQFMNFWSRLFAHFDFHETSCKKALQGSQIPTLILHGEKDRLVPADMSRELAEELSDRVELVLFPEAGHGQSVYYDTAKYEKAVLSFFERTK